MHKTYLSHQRNKLLRDRGEKTMGIENISGTQNAGGFKYEVRMGDSIKSIAEKSLFSQGLIGNDGKFDGKVSKESQALLQKEIDKIKSENKKELKKGKNGIEYFIAVDKIKLGGDVEKMVPINPKTEHPNQRKNVEVTSDKFKGMPVVTHTLAKGETLEGTGGILYKRVQQMYAKEKTVTMPNGETKKFPAVTDEAKLLKLVEEYSSAIIGAESASERDTRKWQPGKEIQIPSTRMDAWESFAGKAPKGERKFAPNPAPAKNEIPEVVVTAPRIKPQDNPYGVSQPGFYNSRIDNVNVDTPWGKRVQAEVVPPYIYKP